MGGEACLGSQDAGPAPGGMTGRPSPRVPLLWSVLGTRDSPALGTRWGVGPMWAWRSVSPAPTSHAVFAAVRGRAGRWFLCTFWYFIWDGPEAPVLGGGGRVRSLFLPRGPTLHGRGRSRAVFVWSVIQKHRLSRTTGTTFAPPQWPACQRGSQGLLCAKSG